MTNPSDELMDILSTHLTGSPEHPSQKTREYWLMEHLVEIIEGYEHGEYTRKEVQDIFSDHPLEGFDVGQWIDRKISEGVYAEDNENET